MRLGKKKGNIHIDWVVSIGIFLTFVIVLLAFIKPSYKPEYEGDVLTDMVEQEFMERAEWIVGRALLNLDCDSSGIKSFNIKEYIPEANNFQVLDKNLVLATNSYTTSGGFKLKVNSGKNQYYIIFSDYTGYSSGNLQGDATNVECDISSGNPSMITGIREDTLNNLANLNIDQWDFPQFRQFRIRVLDSNGNFKYCFAKGGISGNDCENIQIPGQIQIYAADKGEFFLNPDLTKTQVILNILVW